MCYGLILMLYTVGWSPGRWWRPGGGLGGVVVQEFGTFLSVFVYAQTEESCERPHGRLERGCVIEKAVRVLMCV